MKVTDLLVESNQQIDEVPAGMIGQGIKKLASKIPGSIGAKAQGSYDTGRVANQLYKEFYTYLGRSNQQASDESLAAFLKSKGIDDELINKHVGSAAPAAAQATAATPAVKKKAAVKKPVAKAAPVQTAPKPNVGFQQRAAAARAQKAKPIRESLDTTVILLDEFK